MKVLIRGALLLDPGATPAGRRGDLLIREGRIEAIGEQLPQGDAQVIEAGGLVLAPGLVDLHVHLRYPGQTHKEDLATGGRAAAAGGVTTFCAMPNTTPAVDNVDTLQDIRLQAQAVCPVKLRQAAAITVGLRGERPTDLAALAAAGAAAFTDDGRPVLSSAHMKQALIEAARLGLPVFSHSEDLTLPPEDPASEAIAVAREIALAEQTGCPVHICHVSSAQSVRLLRDARAAGLPVTAETAPHYLTLTAEEVRGDPNRKMNPPLRGERDRQAVCAALCEGVIDVIATDHAPHSPAEKALPYAEAPNGVVGLETSLAAAITALVVPGLLSLPALFYRMATRPAEILGVPGGRLLPGAPADLVLLDPVARWRVEPDRLHSRSKNTPFAGRELTGRVKLTLVDGSVVYRDDRGET
ncbi:MAG: dihydroorotase [Clostridiales bacterium]|nr:dihydroorotase [Clostridiales bacterium]